MINNSSRERLKMAHQMLDKELENSTLGPRSTNATDSARTKNVQS